MSRRYTLRIPARVNILGNPTDANEGDFATISAAINIYAGGAIEEADEYILQWIERDKPSEPTAEFRTSDLEGLECGLSVGIPLKGSVPPDLFRHTAEPLPKDPGIVRNEMPRNGATVPDSEV